MLGYLFQKKKNVIKNQPPKIFVSMGCDVENESKASLIANDAGSIISEIQDIVMKTETLNTRIEI